MKRKEILYLVIAGSIGGILLLGFLWVLFTRPVPPPTPSQGIVPTVTTFYSQSDAKRVVELVKNRITLSDQDAQARAALLEVTNGETGIIHTEQSFSLLYLKTPDLFQSEILISDVQSAKQATASWLASQGLTSEGICHLPLTFYLSQDVSTVLHARNESFSPLPPGC